MGRAKTLILLRDFHLFLQDPNPILIRQLKDVLQMAKTKSKTLIILGCRMVPSEHGATLANASGEVNRQRRLRRGELNAGNEGQPD